MQEVVNFLIENWQVISSCLCLLISIIIFILKKKPQTSLFSVCILKVLSLLPELIKEAEKECAPKSGVIKKDFVINSVYGCMQKLLGRSLTTDEMTLVHDSFDEYIEDILSAPQKKGE